MVKYRSWGPYHKAGAGLASYFAKKAINYGISRFRSKAPYGYKLSGRGFSRRKMPRYRKGLRGRYRGKMRIAGYYGRYNKRNLVRAELKFHDLDIVDTAIATGGTITPSWNLIPQGTTEIQRLGRKCTIKHIAWRFSMTKTQEVTSSADSIVRMIVYLDKQANGAAATVTDILENGDFQSFYNLANSSRFRILIDRTYDMNSFAGGAGTALQSYTRSTSGMMSKRVNIPLEFSSTTGAITEIRSNNVGLLLISNRGQVRLDSSMRIRFTG